MVLAHKTLRNDIRKMNLYIIDNSTNEKIYNYFANYKDRIFKILHSDEISSNADQYFHAQAGNTKVVYSASAGLGKTFWIEQDARRQKKVPIYFPVAGNLDFSRLIRRIRDL
jgi:hypothetical protein